MRASKRRLGLLGSDGWTGEGSMLARRRLKPWDHENPEAMNHEDNVKQAVPLFAVLEMARSVRFYVDGLGFVMTQQWRDGGVLRWCRLELGGAALMLQEFPKEGHDSWRPEGKVGEGVTLYFICADALAIYRAAKARGLAISQPEVGNVMWVTRLMDPDGYGIAFESLTDAPEDAVYTG
jgi:catechol 2,3-dioxygenase-like lactoylglutathione lyase family enzyme